jgi:hypothetical protein
MVELDSREARLAPEVRSVTMGLGVLDTGALGGLRRLGLCLGGRGHERNQRM